MPGEEFDLTRTLGEGAFGKVYLVTSKLDGKLFAMKVIDLRTSPQEEKELAVSEANLLKTLKHPNVLSYTDSYERDGALCIVTEYCANGDLSEYLERRKKRKLEEELLTTWFKQIAQALEYLHGKKIMHRDIKTPNIFLTEDWQTKLGDMGLAKVLDRPNAKAVTFCGSPYYMSPEIFSCKPYDFKSDIWALGVIVYELSTLERPFDAMLMHQLVFKIVHGGLPQMPTGYRPELVQLLKSILQKDPDQRPSAADILQHKYFQDTHVLANASSSIDEEEKVFRKKFTKVPPIPKEGGAAAQAVAGKNPFNMGDLLDTLSMVRQQGATAAHGMAVPDAIGAEGAVGGSGQPAFEGKLKGIETIMAKGYKSPPKKKFEKTLKNISVKRAVPSRRFDPSASTASLSQVTMYVRDPKTDPKEDFDSTIRAIQTQTAHDAFNVMQLIVRTMTGMIPNDDKEKEEVMKRSNDPQAMMLRQIEHLQYYCTKVLGQDLFMAAHELLGNERDDQKLEERLQSVLGPDYFEKCGVQLMFLKNYEYNLDKLLRK